MADTDTRSWWKQVTDATADERRAWNKQGGILHSNEAINGISGVPEMAARMFNGGESLKQAWGNTFTEKVADPENAGKFLRKTRWGKLAGSVWAAGTAASIGFGAVRGALTDRNGNFDVPGIPFI